MPSFVTPTNGDDALAEHVAQLTENLSGLRNIPIQLSGINDATNYALTVKNVGTGSKDTIMYAADGTTVLLQVDDTGVKASASGGAAAPILTTGSTIGVGQLADASVTNAKLASDTARANLLTNGGFEIWQRGNGPFTTNGVYASDRWVLFWGAGSSGTVTRETTEVDASASSTKIVYTHAASSTHYQALKEEATGLRGRTLSCSIRAKTSVAGGIVAAIYESVAGYTSGVAHTGSGQWETLTVSLLIPAGATEVRAAVRLLASGTYYIDNATLVVGSVAADYAPLHPADELARCERYYEVLGDPSGAGYYLTGQVTATTQALVPWQFRTAKAVTPTITVTNPTSISALNTSGGSLIASTAVSAPSLIRTVGAYLQLTTAGSLVAGQASLTHLGATAQVSSEANP